MLNYVILRPLCTLLAALTAFFHRYGQGKFSLKKSYIYLAAVTSLSQVVGQRVKGVLHLAAATTQAVSWGWRSRGRGGVRCGGGDGWK